MSPFNVSARVPMHTFTEPEVRTRFDEYTKEWWGDSVSVSDEVVSAIVADTGGHKGWTTTAAARLHSAVKLGNFKGEYCAAEWAELTQQYKHDLIGTIIGHAVKYARGISGHFRLVEVVQALVLVVWAWGIWCWLPYGQLPLGSATR
jgi:hypothetical protein